MEPPPLPPVSSPSLPRRVHFDEQGYLQLHPDIASGVADGKIASGWEHYVQSGHREARTWLPQADPLAGVSREISPDDEMLRGNETHYFDVGASALQSIEAAVLLSRRPRQTIRRILDLPCGHGRVMRFLRKAFPEAELVACDLNRSGVDFCARTFGAVPEYSHENVDLIPHEGVVDLIWCGSLLTHLPEAQCRAFIRFFHRILGHRGILLFTMHGRSCVHELTAPNNRYGIGQAQGTGMLNDYLVNGFGFAPYAATATYGISLAHPAFVTGRLLDETHWRLLAYHETGWGQHQDVISAQKNLPAS